MLKEFTLFTISVYIFSLVNKTSKSLQLSTSKIIVVTLSCIKMTDVDIIVGICKELEHFFFKNEFEIIFLFMTTLQKIVWKIYKENEL
jgi:hypothetical protein